MHPSQKKEAEEQHEADGAAEGASFFGTGIKVAAHTVKEKVASVVGLSEEKPISKNENMGPAGQMQGRNPDANAEEEYASMKDKSQKAWKEAKISDDPPQQYPAHGRNS